MKRPKKSVRRDRAAEAELLLRKIASKHMLSVKTLRGKERFPHIVRARREFCVRAQEANIGCIIAAKVLWCHHATVMYHQRPEMQMRRHQKYLARRAETHQPTA